MSKNKTVSRLCNLIFELERFLNFNISNAMHLRCGGIFNDHLIRHLVTAESTDERILKIGECLAKL